MGSCWHDLFLWLWERVYGQHAQFCVCTSVVPRAMTVVFGLGMRLHTRLENVVLRNKQKSGNAVNTWLQNIKVSEADLMCAVLHEARQKY